MAQTHHAISIVFETPSGILGERYSCSCGSQSTAAQMAQTPGGQEYSSLFGHRPCEVIWMLHASGVDEITVQE